MLSSALSSVDYTGVSQFQHYRYLGLSNSLLGWGGHPAHCQVFRSITGLYWANANCTSSHSDNKKKISGS